jgi:mannose-6-phosphate isomerase-like protein (cupin superfamily)
MSDYSVAKLSDVDDLSGDAPGTMQMVGRKLGCEQVAMTYRRMPAGAGGILNKRLGHHHNTQEEIYFVVSGTMQLKLDDEVLEVGPKTAVRMAPEVVRCVWNDGPEDLELLMFSNQVEDLRAETQMHEGFWDA